MLAAWLKRRVRALARTIGDDLAYVESLIDASLPSALAFAVVALLSMRRGMLSTEALHVARILAARSEDCAGCLQTTVTMARRDGMSAALVRAIVTDDDVTLGELRDVHALVTQFLAGAVDDATQARVRMRIGHRGLADLALVVTCTRVVPLTKRMLGASAHCVPLRYELAS